MKKGEEKLFSKKAHFFAILHLSSSFSLSSFSPWKNLITRLVKYVLKISQLSQEKPAHFLTDLSAATIIFQRTSVDRRFTKHV